MRKKVMNPKGLKLESKYQQEKIIIHPNGYQGLAGFHKYWGKKPTEAWRFLIDNFTESGDIVLDPFLGSGLIARECIDLNRRFIGFDLNPISIELTKLYLDLPDYSTLKKAINEIFYNIKPQIDIIYRIPSGEIISHFLWEEGKIKTLWKKEKGKRIQITVPQEIIENLETFNEYCIKGIRQSIFFENSRINSYRNMTFNDLFTPRALQAIDLLLTAINQYNEQIKRALLLILTASLGQMSNMVFAVTNRGKTKGQTYDKVEVGSWVIGYWRPEQHFEINSWNCFENKAKKLLNSLKIIDQYSLVNIVNNYESFKILNTPNHLAYIQIGDSEQLLKDIPDNTLKLILTDPPHGDRIPYLELSEMWNCCLSLEANFEDELIISNAKERRKTKDIYNDKLSKIFAECNRVLMSQGILAVMFNSRAKEHWESLRTLEKVTDLEYLGYYPMEYSAGSVVQDNRKGGLKTDYVLIYVKQLTELRKNQILQIFSKIQAWEIQYPIKESK